MVDRDKILNAVKTAIEKAPERKFSESIDITINLKNIDMAQPKNRIDETIMLPHGTGEKIGICVIGKGDIVTQAKDAKVDLIIGPEEVERLGGAPREARKVASGDGSDRSCNWDYGCYGKAGGGDVMLDDKHLYAC